MVLPLRGLHVGHRVPALPPNLRVGERTPARAPIVRRSGDVLAQVLRGRRHAVVRGVCSRIVRVLHQGMSARRTRRKR